MLSAAPIHRYASTRQLVKCMRSLPTILRLATSRSAITSRSALTRTATRRCALTRTMATKAVDTLIFDVDDTLYPVSSGFSKHRNGPIVAKFMVDELGFETEKEALALRDEVFRETHSTLKGLTLASARGNMPKPFEEHMLGDYWAAHCEFDAFLPRNEEFRSQLAELKQLGYKLVVFSNAPRKYARRCLDSLGLRDLFRDDFIFGVEDVMPACKPEKEAFQTVLDAVGADAESSVMFEDSLKNIRACRALGMRCVFVEEEVGGEAALLGDSAAAGDADLYDAKIRRIADLKGAAPWLWERKSS